VLTFYHLEALIEVALMLAQLLQLG